jgi:hypothetical protein
MQPLTYGISMSSPRKFSEATIERCPHDQENPYVQISRDLIRDKNISPNCRMLLIFLLSNKDYWRINTTQLRKEFKGYLGRDAIRNLLNEAIEAGYIKREPSMEDGLPGYRYYLSEKPKFKKCLRSPEKPGPGNQAPGNQGHKEEYQEERISKKKEYPKVSKTPVHKIVDNPEPIPLLYVPPLPHPDTPAPVPISIPSFTSGFSIGGSTDPVADQVELLRMEPKYVPFFRPHIVARWTTTYGASAVLRAMKFFFHIKETNKKPIDKPEAWMELALRDKYAETADHCARNKLFAENFKKTYALRNLKINKRYCQDMRTGKDYYYHLPQYVFEEQLNCLLDS